MTDFSLMLFADDSHPESTGPASEAEPEPGGEKLGKNSKSDVLLSTNFYLNFSIILKLSFITL